MPIEAKRLLALAFAMFALMAMGLGYVQIILRGDLQADPRNPYLALADPDVSRGGIRAQGGEIICAGLGVDSRRYTVPSLCHILGYIDPSYGASGMEAVYNNLLTGSDLWAQAANTLSVLKGRRKSGADLVTTIDLRLQRAATNALGSRTGAVVVMDAATGGILAMVSRPFFHNPPTKDSWQRDLARDDAPLLNRATQGLYPPGSVYKLIVAAAAMRAGLEDFTTDCRGQTAVEGRRITEDGQGGHGVRVDLRKALKVSCNIYFVRLAVKIGADKLISQAMSFGLHRQTPFALPVAAGSLPRPVSGAELVENGIGQGRILVTPLQMALVAAAIVNDGIIIQPRLVDCIRYPGGRAVKIHPRAWCRALDVRSGTLIKEDMIEAVRHGTGWRAAAGNSIVGGKTGTAQATGGRPHAWFIGFRQRGNSRLAVAIVVEHAGSGGAVAAPIAAAVWRAAAGGVE